MDEEQLEEHTNALNNLLEEAQSHVNKLIQESYVAPNNAMEHWAGELAFLRRSFDFSQHLLPRLTGQRHGYVACYYST